MQCRLVLAPFFFLSLTSRADTLETKGRVFYDTLSMSKPSFLFVSRREDKDGTTTLSSTFTDMQGKPLTSEQIDLKGDRPMRYVYTQSQVTESGDAQLYQDKIQMTFTSYGKTERDSEKFDPTTVVAPMVQPLLQKSWDDLMKGDSVKVRYLLIERLETIGFKFYKDAERNYKGTPAVDILMKPSSFIIAALVSPIRITVQKAAPHWILESEGRLPIRWPKVTPPVSRNDWKAIDARVEYDVPVTVPGKPPTQTASPAGK